jgi:hypothetical protein
MGNDDDKEQSPRIAVTSRKSTRRKIEGAGQINMAKRGFVANAVKSGKVKVIQAKPKKKDD